MIGNFNFKNHKLLVIIIVIAILIPVALFVVASIYNKSKIGNANKDPLVEVPSPQSNEKIVYELDLDVGVPVLIPDTNIELELISTSLQDSDCFDCIASTIIEVRKNGDVKIWDYVCGGFSGKCNYEFKEFGYVIEAVDLKAQFMKVKVYLE